MQPQQESCRNKARVAAYVDIVLDVLELLFYVWGCYFCIRAMLYAHSSQLNGWFYVTALLIFLLLVLNGVAIWMSVGLLNATNPTTAPNQALGKTKLWRLYFLIFLFGSGIILFVSSNSDFEIIGGTNIFGAILCAPLLYIVHKFIQELQSVGGGAPIAGSSQSQQQPQNRKDQP